MPLSNDTAPIPITPHFHPISNLVSFASVLTSKPVYLSPSISRRSPTEAVGVKSFIKSSYLIVKVGDKLDAAYTDDAVIKNADKISILFFHFMNP